MALILRELTIFSVTNYCELVGLNSINLSSQSSVGHSGIWYCLTGQTLKCPQRWFLLAAPVENLFLPFPASKGAHMPSLLLDCCLHPHVSGTSLPLVLGPGKQSLLLWTPVIISGLSPHLKTLYLRCKVPFPFEVPRLANSGIRLWTSLGPSLSHHDIYLSRNLVLGSHCWRVCVLP